MSDQERIEAKYQGEILATLRYYDYSTPNISEFFHTAVAAAAIGAFGDTEKDVLVKDGVKAGDFGTPQVIVTEVAPERAHLAWPILAIPRWRVCRAVHGWSFSMLGKS